MWTRIIVKCLSQSLSRSTRHQYLYLFQYLYFLCMNIRICICMNAIVECEAIVKSLSQSRSCSTRHSLNICLPRDKYMTTRNVSLENTGFENTKKYITDTNIYFCICTALLIWISRTSVFQHTSTSRRIYRKYAM